MSSLWPRLECPWVRAMGMNLSMPEVTGSHTKMIFPMKLMAVATWISILPGIPTSFSWFQYIFICGANMLICANSSKLELLWQCSCCHSLFCTMSWSKPEFVTMGMVMSCQISFDNHFWPWQAHRRWGVGASDMFRHVQSLFIPFSKFPSFAYKVAEAPKSMELVRHWKK